MTLGNHKNARRGFPHLNEFSVLEAFVAVALFGLVSGAVYLWLFPPSTGPATGSSVAASAVPAVAAPTSDEYRTSVKAIMAPFITQATTTAFGSDTEAISAMRGLVSTTQDRLLRLRVPGEERDAHLAFVLLLDRWKRALDGTPADRDDAARATADLIAAHSWVAADLQHEPADPQSGD